MIWASADLKLGGVRNAKLRNEAQLLEFFKAYPGLRKIIGTRLIVYGLDQPEPPSLDDKTLSDHFHWVNSVSWHPTQPLFASGSSDKTVRIYDTRDWKVVKTLSDHSDWVNSVSWHPTLPLLASGSEDKTVRIYYINCGHGEALRGGARVRLRDQCVIARVRMAQPDIKNHQQQRTTCNAVSSHKE